MNNTREQLENSNLDAKMRAAYEPAHRVISKKEAGRLRAERSFLLLFLVPVVVLLVYAFGGF